MSHSHDFKKNLPLQPNHLLPASIKIPLPASYTERVMSSQRRIDSSRANGAKSRGAVTPAGKYNSSRNNLRHGLLAKSAVLEEERSEAFLELLADLTREHNAQTETQRTLVEHMAMARWRIARLWAIERELLQSEIHKPEHIQQSPTARVTRAFASLVERDGVFSLLNRYEARFDRQYARSLNLLIKLADPETPLTEFFHSNPVPQSDTPSGIGLPACDTPVPHPSPGDEVASLSPTPPTPPESPAHAEPAASGAGLPPCPTPERVDQPSTEPSPDPRPLIPGPRPLTPDPQPLTPDPQPPNPGPQPQTPDSQPLTLGSQPIATPIFPPPRNSQSQQNAPVAKNPVTHLRPTG